MLEDTLTALGLLAAWFLVFPIAPSPFSEVDQRFRYFIRNGFRQSQWSPQRDYRWFWKKLPLWAYYLIFVIWHSALTLGVFLGILAVAWIHWGLSRRKPPDMPALGLHGSLQVIGIVMLLAAVIVLLVNTL
jgi:hypothetical protein